MELKLFLIISLINLSKETKRKYEENLPTAAKYDHLDEFDFSNKKIKQEDLSDLLHSSSSTYDQSYTELTKYEDSYDESKTVLPILCFTDFPNKINDALEIKKDTSFELKSEISVEEHKHFEFNCIKIDRDCDEVFKQEEIDFNKTNYFDINEDYNTSSNVHKKDQSNLNYSAFGEVIFVNSDKYSLKSYIEKYISDNISETNNCNFLKKMKLISEACDIFDKHKVNNTVNYSSMFSSNDKAFLNRLIYVFSNFNKNSSFNKEMCSKFSIEFDLNFKSFFYPEKLRLELEKLSDDQQAVLFFSKLMNLYEYSNDIPEILTLCGLFSKKSFCKLIVVIHLIHLFAENVNGELKENRFFFLCMISKAFECLYIKQFDIFLLPIYYVECCKGEHSLNYFIWEFSHSKRQEIKRRKRTHLNNSQTDLKYLNTALLLYLYQHTIFMKYFNVDSKYIEKFQTFVQKVTEFKTCVGCLFNEYLSVIRNLQ